LPSSISCSMSNKVRSFLPGYHNRHNVLQVLMVLSSRDISLANREPESESYQQLSATVQAHKHPHTIVKGIIAFVALQSGDSYWHTSSYSIHQQHPIVHPAFRCCPCLAKCCRLSSHRPQYRQYSSSSRHHNMTEQRTTYLSNGYFHQLRLSESAGIFFHISIFIIIIYGFHFNIATSIFSIHWPT